MAQEDPVSVELTTKMLGIRSSVAAARRNLLGIVPRIATERPILSGKLVQRWHMIMDPGGVQRVLKDNVWNYPKSPVTRLILEPAVGQGLFVAEGANWRWQRRAAAPAFAPRNIEALAPIMTAAAEATLARIGRGGVMDIYEETITATFEVITDVTISGDDGPDREAVHHAVNRYIEQAARLSLFDVLGLPGWVPRPGRLFSAPIVRRLRRITDATIARRAAGGPRPVPDLLDLLLAGQDPETGRRMTPPELRDNLLTFIVAGHETTALTLAWALYLCAFDPVVQEAAATQARDVLGERAAGVDDLAQLPLVRQIVEESLRLYPPAAFLSRVALEGDELVGREIRAGDIVMLPIYALHRHKLLWERPDSFDPSRFAGPPQWHRFTFLPFGAGPRICIGAGFAMQEAIIILASLLARLRFRHTAQRPDPRMIVTLRPYGGVWLLVAKR